MASLTHWPFFRRWFGHQAERAAARFLRRSGLRILAWNYRTAQGEVDLIARDGSCLVFVEVRSTAGMNEEPIAASIDWKKQRRITAAARHFIHCCRLHECPTRFDVVLVRWISKSTPLVSHIRSAFDATD